MTGTMEMKGLGFAIFAPAVLVKIGKTCSLAVCWQDCLSWPFKNPKYDFDFLCVIYMQDYFDVDVGYLGVQTSR